MKNIVKYRDNNPQRDKNYDLTIFNSLVAA
ncbi:MAG: hypothetical protein ACI87N_003269 [Flavobacteriales bacterium]